MFAYNGIDAQIKPKAEYNALQVGITDTKNFRGRIYTNIGLQNNAMGLGFHGLNEAGKDYLFGRETIRIGSQSIPIDAIYTTRLAGEKINNIKQIDEATGIRINNLEVDINGTRFVEYGWIDIVKHFGKNYKGLEAVLFAGKSIGDGALEATFALKNNGQKYLEIEALTPSVDIIPEFKIRAYSRVEMPNATFENPTYVAGVQAQL